MTDDTKIPLPIFLPKLPVVSLDTINSCLGDASETALMEGSHNYLVNILQKIEEKNHLLYSFMTAKITKAQETSRKNGADEEFCQQLKIDISAEVAQLYGLLESQLEADYFKSLFGTGGTEAAAGPSLGKTRDTPQLPVISEDTFLSYLVDLVGAKSADGAASYIENLFSDIEAENFQLYMLLMLTAQRSGEICEAKGVSSQFSEVLRNEAIISASVAYALLKSQLEADFLNAYSKLN
jgi:hypothetical protein